MNKRRALRALSMVLVLSGASLIGEQAWLGIKAQAAGILIHRSFEAYLRDGRPRPPWSWADMYPVARLEVPRLGIDRIVLSGASGSSMAFGPGHIDGTAPPGASSNCVLSGHRDTWFSFLSRLRLGDEVRLVSRSGITRYKVKGIRIISMWETSILEPTPGPQLVLLTCYPFTGLVNSPWRYGVICIPEEIGETACTAG